MKIYKTASTLKDFAEIKTNFEDADFWIIRKGDINKVGSPTKQFSSEHIGIKIINNMILPDYLYYAFMNMQTQGFFKQFAHGTTNLVNIKIEDIKNITLN